MRHRTFAPRVLAIAQTRAAERRTLSASAKEHVLQTPKFASPFPMSGTTERDAAIRRILDARFSLAVLEALRENDPLEWNSARNAIGRGIHGEAMRESQRLAQVSAAELEAELADAAFRDAQRRFD